MAVPELWTLAIIEARMTPWQFIRGIELRDTRTARTRAWMRLCHVSIGMAVAIVIWDALHPHDLIGVTFLIMAVLMAVIIAAAGAIYDFWRVRHPEKTNRYEWLRVGVVSLFAGEIYAFLALWIIKK